MGSEKRKPYAEVMKEMAESTREEKRAQEVKRHAQKQAAYKRAYKKEKARLENGDMQQFFDKEWKRQIDEQAKLGENEMILNVQRNRGRSATLSAENQALYEVGLVYLMQEGFSAEVCTRFSEGTGGDDPYPEETFVGIKVKW